MGFQDPPLLSIATPMQMVLWTARALGRGPQALEKVLASMVSKDRKAQVFAGYEAQPHDVFLACFSKSGTNWSMQLVTQISHRGAAEFGHIHEIVAWPESAFPGIIPLDDLGPMQRAPTKLRGIKTALEAEYVPYSMEAKYVTIIRDPKDVCVSAYDFLTGIFGLREQVDLPTWVEMMFTGGGLLSNWPAHTASHWALRERENVLLLDFAEMKQDLPAAVDALCTLLKVELSEGEREEVIRRGSFAYMQEHESCFAPPHLRLLTGKSKGKMMRAGKVGRSKQLLTPAERERIDSFALAEFERLGSDFPYAERFMAR